MRTSTSQFRFDGWFAVAIAAAAAACADAAVEGLSNNHAFGPGRFTDGSNADLAPVALIGFAFLARFFYLRVRARLRGVRTPGNDAAPAHAAWRMLPVIFVAQIAMLWLMETTEQHVVFGHGFGPWIWLGGPAAFSLTAHALVCVAFTFGARALVRSLEPRAARIVRALCALLDVAAGAPPVVAVLREAPIGSSIFVVITLLRGRAPPSMVRLLT